MSNAPSLSLDEVRELPASVSHKKRDTFYTSGETDRPSDRRIVAVVLGVRAEIKASDRDFSGPMNFHEIAILRRYIDGRGGGAVRMTSGWPAGLPRFRALTQSDLTAECTRMAQHYVVPRGAGQPPIMVFNNFFGAQPIDQLKAMHKLLSDQYARWRELMVDAYKRIPPTMTVDDPAIMESMAMDYLYERELEEIALMADPSKKGLDTIELPSLSLDETAAKVAAAQVATPGEPAKAPEKTLAELEAEADAEVDPTDKLVEALKARGVAAGVALNIAVAAEKHGGFGKIPNDELVKLVGDKERAKSMRAAMGA